MKPIYKKSLACAVALICGSFSTGVLAHAFVESPVSRSFHYYSNGNHNLEWPADEVEGPKIPAGGNMEGDTAYEHQFGFPPDGKIASGNNPNRSVLDNESYAWPQNAMKSGPQQFLWHFGAPHRTTYFTYYITKPDWKSKPGYGQRLTAEMFEDKPFCHEVWAAGQPLPPKHVTHTCNVPQRTGEQKIYAVWRIRDTANAFYQLIDVKFDGTEIPGNHQKPIIHVGNDRLVVEQSPTSEGYTMDASATEHATNFKWEVISGASNFQLQTASGAPTSTKLEGKDMKAPRAWVAKNHVGKGTYRLTVSNQYGSASKDISVEVKAKEAQQKPVISVANSHIVVEQSPTSQGYVMDASATKHATHYKWEVISGSSNFQLQTASGAPTSTKLEGKDLNAPRAWVAQNHTGKGSYRLTASNQFGEMSQVITVEVKPKETGGGDAPAYNARIAYPTKCTKVSHNGKVWENQWHATVGQEEPGKGGQWGIWRLKNAADNSCK
uniref:lytic polysaccharide monooxygenase n=1 Tax=Scandinavium goeteborgense TaxID=1851514 RepID=UPI00135A0F8B|nr:lytic polysaccharide monooxygenase [Scandinavium goeteborgense]